MCALKVKPALSADSDFTVAIATVHRFVTTGFKGYLGILAALGTFYREHLPLESVARATVSITLWFPCLATGGQRLGSLVKPLPAKNSCSEAVKVNFAPQSEHWIDLS
jgi:hypothetical protein